MEIIVILDNIRSIHNVGSIFRTADAAGIKKIYLCGITPGPVDEWGRKVGAFAKVSLGAEDYIEWGHVKTTGVAISKLRKAGYKILAIEQSKDSIDYRKIKLEKDARIALVLGPEVQGMSKTILKKVDHVLEIPMYGKKESLNVSVAFGIVIFSLRDKK